jgi:hypothetical protein
LGQGTKTAALKTAADVTTMGGGNIAAAPRVSRLALISASARVPGSSGLP